MASALNDAAKQCIERLRQLTSELEAAHENDDLMWTWGAQSRLEKQVIAPVRQWLNDLPENLARYDENRATLANQALQYITERAVRLEGGLTGQTP